ncbi:MAG: HAD-IA family hydrolase [Chitinispirillaceae bacterium]|nr:HAD-IA family hydrolase [Chitinispirillaceae bacterium]
MKIKEYDCYLFDADGTLFDTTDMIVNCFENTAKSHNLPVPTREMVVKHVGMTLRAQMECYFGKLSDDVFNKYKETHMSYQLKIYKKYLKLCPGVAEALSFLKSKKKKCGVVTSRMLNTLKLFLNDTNIYQFFDILITPEATSAHKPDPAPVLVALERLKVDPPCCLFIGDATYDIECGKRAGVDTAFVMWSHNPPTSLRVEPDYYFYNMNEICKWS